MARTIAVTGKGGVGKTVVAALIISYLRQHASGAVLAIDADPDANLGTVLGVPIPKTLGDVREDTLNEIKRMPAGMSKAAYIETGLHETIVEIIAHQGAGYEFCGCAEAWTMVRNSQVVVDGFGNVKSSKLIAGIYCHIVDYIAGVCGIIAADIEKVAYVLLFENVKNFFAVFGVRLIPAGAQRR